MIILVDMDGVIADFENHFINVWRNRYPDFYYCPFEQRKSFKIRDDYPKELREKVKLIYHEQFFCLNLPVINGAKEALDWLIEQGNEVFICTSPLSDFKFSIYEKYSWLARHFGTEWCERVILTKDKTLVQADILIDDKPEITGVSTPVWEHVLFEAPYNQLIKNKRRINWKNFNILFN